MTTALFVFAGLFIYDMIIQRYDYYVFYPWKLYVTTVLLLYGAYFARYSTVVSVMELSVIGIELLWWVPIAILIVVAVRMIVRRRVVAEAWRKLVHGSNPKPEILESDDSERAVE